MTHLLRCVLSGRLRHAIRCGNNREEIFRVGTDYWFYAEKVGIAGRENTKNVPQSIKSDPIDLLTLAGLPLPS